MSPAGAFLALWNDIEHGREPEYDDWHTREHVPERVSAPGFRTGLRYVDRCHPLHRYFTLYEVDDMAAFHTAEYRDLLQNPTPWSASMRPSFRNFLRVTCAARLRFGYGRGGVLAVLRVTEDAGAAARLRALAAMPGIVAARLGRHDACTPTVAWRTPAPEPGSAVPFDSVLLVDALDRAAAQAALGAATDGFAVPGGGDAGGIYDLAYAFPGEDAAQRAAHRRPGWASTSA
ncbi:hypothetical protein MHZ93_18600 [Roseomonas sp. ACRSG]|nr:hypothetical protein [Roseomonas sp. ACRSG]